MARLQAPQSAAQKLRRAWSCLSIAEQALSSVNTRVSYLTARVTLQLSAPKHGENVSLLVAVRVRPILQFEVDKGRGSKDILRVMDDRVVLVMDPDPDDKDYLDQVQNRSKVRMQLQAIFVAAAVK